VLAESETSRRVRALELQGHESRWAAFCDEMEASGRINSPTDRAAVKRAFDVAPDATIALVSGRPVKEPPVARRFTTEEDTAYASEAAARFGLSAEKLV
jgi:hypothetical protein